MADSSNSNERQLAYYCHVCKCRVPSMTESSTCPSCDSGFIEEVESAAQQPDNSNDLFSIFSTGSGDPQNENFFNILSNIDMFSQNANHINLGRFLTSVLSSAQANGGGQFIRFLHGNPDDYVWSSDSLDSVITQLLNQIDNAGPPPMSPEDISNLNEILITKDHVSNKLQCPICMEDFILDEKVKELVCHHFFHNDCIVEWLKLHSTCPTCRMNFSGDKTQNASTSMNAPTNTISTSRPEIETIETSLNTPTTNQPTGYNFNDDDLD